MGQCSNCQAVIFNDNVTYQFFFFFKIMNMKKFEISMIKKKQINEIKIGLQEFQIAVSFFFSKKVIRCCKKIDLICDCFRSNTKREIGF